MCVQSWDSTVTGGAVRGGGILRSCSWRNCSYQEWRPEHTISKQTYAYTECFSITIFFSYPPRTNLNNWNSWLEANTDNRPASNTYWGGDIFEGVHSPRNEWLGLDETNWCYIFFKNLITITKTSKIHTSNPHTLIQYSCCSKDVGETVNEWTEQKLCTNSAHTCKTNRETVGYSAHASEYTQRRINILADCPLLTG